MIRETNTIDSEGRIVKVVANIEDDLTQPPDVVDDEYEDKAVDAVDIVSDCYRDLSKYVAETRVYCSSVDGMKAVHRRTIYASAPHTKRVKSAVLVGDGLKYHPHGDGNVYGAVVGMTCKFGRFPLYDGKGNFGGLGSRCAAMRYTESTLSDLGRLMCLSLIDYADFIDGEAGNREPRRLPTLLPYAFLVGSGGIPVGLPPAVIPQLDSLQLLDYYVSKLKGEEGVVPLPDFGNCIINVEPEEARQVIKSGRGKLWFKGLVVQEDEHRFVITEGTPNKDVHNVLKKLQWYIDNDIVDYTDDSGESPRHVFEIYDKGKITPEELRYNIEKALACSVTYKYIFVDDDNTAVYCGLDYVVDSSINYLKACTIRKYTDYKSKADKSALVLRAIEDFRNSGRLKDIGTLTQEELRDVIADLGHDPEIAWEATKKPISYLTKSHEDELNNIRKDIDQYARYIEKPEEYLLTLYDELRVHVKKLHDERTHSIVGTNITTSNVECYARLNKENNTLQLSDTQVEGSIPWKYKLFLLKKDGNVEERKVSKVPGTEIELGESEIVDICSDEYKYALGLTEDHKYTTTHELSNLKNNWVHDGSYVFERFIPTNEEVIKVVEYNKEYDYIVKDWIRKRRGNPHRISPKPVLSIGDVKFNG